MRELGSAVSHDLSSHRTRRVFELRERKSGQVLAITHDDELAAYQLDDGSDVRPEGERMADGVLIGAVHDQSIVCFVELKSTLKTRRDGADRVDHALSQLGGAIDHFHPSETSGGQRGHGDEHHEAWARGEDPLGVMPEAGHEVWAVVVGYRAVPRRPPEAPTWVGKTLVHTAVVQVSPAKANRAEASFSDLLRLAGRR